MLKINTLIKRHSVWHRCIKYNRHEHRYQFEPHVGRMPAKRPQTPGSPIPGFSAKNAGCLYALRQRQGRSAGHSARRLYQDV